MCTTRVLRIATRPLRASTAFIIQSRLLMKRRLVYWWAHLQLSDRELRNGLWRYIGWPQAHVSRLFAVSLLPGEGLVSWFQFPRLRTVTSYFGLTVYCRFTSNPFHRTSFHSLCSLDILMWTAILLYNYCLTFVTEVERCWCADRLSWALGLFYLNHYLVLFGHIPIKLPTWTKLRWVSYSKPHIQVDTDIQPRRC